MTWTEHAACRPGDPADWLLPDKHHQRPMSPGIRSQIDRCKAICAGCPVRRECLADAIALLDEAAIRGGLTPEERWERGQKRMPSVRTTCGSHSGYVTHRQRGEVACDDCKAATAAYNRARLARLREAAS